MDSLKTLQAINLAIWLRNNAHLISKQELISNIQDLAKFDLFSCRQIQRICGGRIGYTTIARYIKKSSRTGGFVNPNSLEIIREILYAKHNGQINYLAIRAVLADGTSQNMVSKLTGVAQSTISKYLGGDNGKVVK
jgi:hypothetical protein